MYVIFGLIVIGIIVIGIVIGLILIGIVVGLIFIVMARRMRSTVVTFGLIFTAMKALNEVIISFKLSAGLHGANAGELDVLRSSGCVFTAGESYAILDLSGINQSEGGEGNCSEKEQFHFLAKKDINYLLNFG
jgi:hypothetical protein